MNDSNSNPAWQSLSRDRNFEIRSYMPQTIAEAIVTGPRKEAISKGFQILLKYISGNNKNKQKIKMTAPVLQEGMSSKNEWKIQFIMPPRINGLKESQPSDAKVKLVTIPTQRFGVIRFSGLARDKSLAEHEKTLNNWLDNKKLKVIGRPIYAFYDPPWTLPFLRRNEIMKRIDL